MNRRIVLAACAFSGLLFLAGCPVEYPKCETTDDCVVEGELKGVCVNGTCQECGTDADCKAGFKCERPTIGIGGNRCVPGGCQSNFDCQNGQVCKEGACQACQADNECGPNATCKAGACTPKAECTTDADCGGDQICVDNRCSSKPTGPLCDLGPVRFGFNEYSLTDTSKASLQSLADCLKGKQLKAQVTIEGHCDERGTEEYNMALGDKRATAVKRYLTNLGVAANRLRTVSYGEERPAMRGSDETSWAANRRAEFVVTNP